MDSIRVSEAPDPGSIPGEATKDEAVEISSFSYSSNVIEKINPGYNPGKLNRHK